MRTLYSGQYWCQLETEVSWKTADYGFQLTSVLLNTSTAPYQYRSNSKVRHILMNRKCLKNNLTKYLALKHWAAWHAVNILNLFDIRLSIFFQFSDVALQAIHCCITWDPCWAVLYILIVHFSSYFQPGTTHLHPFLVLFFLLNCHFVMSCIFGV